VLNREGEPSTAGARSCRASRERSQTGTRSEKGNMKIGKSDLVKKSAGIARHGSVGLGNESGMSENIPGAPLGHENGQKRLSAQNRGNLVQQHPPLGFMASAEAYRPKTIYCKDYLLQK
jgi:hypothetical protein